MTKENYFSPKMVKMLDSELRNYIDNKEQFQEGAVLAAIWELEKRNKIRDEDKNIEQDIEIKKEQERERIEESKKNSNIVDYINAPLLYNSKFILIYGALFSVFAGGILMAMNFAKIGKRKLGWIVVLIAFLYSALQFTILEILQINSSLITLPVSYLGVYLLETFFWRKYTSDDLKYRKRSIVGPLVVALAITIPIIYLIIITNQF